MIFLFVTVSWIFVFLIWRGSCSDQELEGLVSNIINIFRKKDKKKGYFCQSNTLIVRKMFVLTRRTLRDEAATARYRVYDKKKIKKDDRIFWLLNVKLAGAKEMVRKTRRSFVLFFLCVFFWVQSFAFWTFPIMAICKNEERKIFVRIRIDWEGKKVEEEGKDTYPAKESKLVMTFPTIEMP